MLKTLLNSTATALAIALTAGVAQAAERHIIIDQALTGAGAFAGAAAAAGAKYAADEINATHYMGADTIKYEVVDDASDRTQAVTIVQKAAADPSILVVVGPTIAPTAIAAASSAAELKIPIMPLSNSMAVLAPGQWAFLTSQPPQVTMPLLAEIAAHRVKVKECVTVSFTDNSAYVELNTFFTEAAEKLGIKIIEQAKVTQAQTDFNAMATRIVSENPDCVVLITNAPTGGNVAAQLRQAGLDPKTKLLGQSGLATPDLVRMGGSSVEGILITSDWAPGGTFPRAQEFAKNFKAKTGTDPDNYDAMGDSMMYVVADAIKRAGPNPTRQSVRDALATTKDVPVPMGTGFYSRDPDRVPHTGVQVLTIKDGKFVPAGE
jgi:branched-chain amino acid transport system substrate-binding protein